MYNNNMERVLLTTHWEQIQDFVAQYQEQLVFWSKKSLYSLPFLKLDKATALTLQEKSSSKGKKQSRQHNFWLSVFREETTVPSAKLSLLSGQMKSATVLISADLLL